LYEFRAADAPVIGAAQDLDFNDLHKP